MNEEIWGPEEPTNARCWPYGIHPGFQFVLIRFIRGLYFRRRFLCFLRASVVKNYLF